MPVSFSFLFFLVGFLCLTSLLYLFFLLFAWHWHRHLRHTTLHETVRTIQRMLHFMCDAYSWPAHQRAADEICAKNYFHLSFAANACVACCRNTFALALSPNVSMLVCHIALETKGCHGCGPCVPYMWSGFCGAPRQNCIMPRTSSRHSTSTATAAKFNEIPWTNFGVDWEFK